MAGMIIGIIAGVLVLTGCGFYFIPKFAMGTSNAWVVAIDTVVDWISVNWIATIVIAVLLLIAILLAVGLSKKCK